MNKEEIINILQQSNIDNEYIRDITAALNKAEKWDKLDAEIGEYYSEYDEDDEDGGALLEIGETTAEAFGYL